MKKDRTKKLFLEQIRKTPIIQICCEKVSVARSTIYRWIKEDKEFDKDLKEALHEGEVLINEMSESQVISLIKEKNWQAISFWLRKRSPRFQDKLQVQGRIETSIEELTEEQQAIVSEALRLASITSDDNKDDNNKNHE